VGYSAYFLFYGTDPVLPFDLWEMTFLIEGLTKGLPVKTYSHYTFNRLNAVIMISQMLCKYCETHALHPNTNLKNSLKPDWYKGAIPLET
jgi:hypothetical protein